MLAGSATVFFAYIGFDSVASTAEEVRISLFLVNPSLFFPTVVILCVQSSFHRNTAT
jgi:amino acid transporter